MSFPNKPYIGRHIFSPLSRSDATKFLARNSFFVSNAMKRLSIFVVAIFFAISGGHSRSETSEASLTFRIDEGANVFGPPPTNSLVKCTSNTEVYVAQDGRVYLVELNSEKILWSFKSGPPIIASSGYYDTSEGDNYNVSEPIEVFLDYGEDGNLYTQAANSYKLKLPWSVEEFINYTPFMTPAGNFILGSKNSILFLIKDPKTGKAICSFKFGEGRSEIFDAEENLNMEKEDFKKLLESRILNFKHKDQPIYVLRKDYEIIYFSKKTGKYLWHLTFSDIEASSQQEISSLDGGKYSIFSPEDDVDSTRKDITSFLNSILMRK